MKNYIFDFDKSNNTSTSIFNFRAEKPDYSKMLDDLIIADVMDKNYYLNTTNTTSKTTTIDDVATFIDAKNFLANYGKNNTPYVYGTTYYIGDTPVIFFEDSIQIGFDLYFYNDFSKKSFFNLLPKKIKKTIIDIYVNGLKISIIQ